jgi:hypothetical protein
VPTQPISGKNGKVLIGSAAVAEVTKWIFNKESVSSRYASSSTGGFKRSLAGVRSGSGTIQFKFDLAAGSPIIEGTAATLLLYLDATQFYSVPALIKTFKVEVNIDTGEVIGGVAEFDTDGTWNEPALP